MKRIKNSIVNFIVDKRNHILVIFTILAFVSLFVSTKVNINHDISAYLPENSETKIGKNIMDENFSGVSTSTLNLMFKNLEEQKKYQVKDTIEDISGVKKVDYDDSENYNKNEYTLYVITVDDKESSKTATSVYDSIVKEYKDYEIYTSGNVSEWNKPVLHLWIIAFAIVSAMVILVIMCESYIEPFLFLYSIGLAVFMNMGTNIMFSSVSHITNSIAAILQLALSMDYSIMLMNRYSQIREKEKDKIKCMKEALLHAAPSIASSSITTIVGLLALVFMSFTIGADLGFVLAKGVLLSLVSIFLSLPALILLFDRIILKTKKKSLNINMTKVGKFVYKLRYPALIMFIIVFGIAFILKNGVNVLYTGTENDEIASVFSENNQIAIIYKSDREDKVANVIENLNNENIKETLALSNTIDEKLSYNEVNKKLNDLGLDISVDDYLLKLVYYNYYNKHSNMKMTINEFVMFVNKEILTNEDLVKNIDSNTKTNINKLSNFSDKTKINKKRDAKDIASILDVEESLIKDLFVLYNSSSPTNKMSISEFVNYIDGTVLKNPKYSSMISEEQKSMIKRVKPFINKSTINAESDAKTLAKMFGLQENDVNKLITLYYMNQENNIKLSLKEILNGVNIISSNTNYLDGVDLSKLSSLSTFINNQNNINNTKLNKRGLESVFASINTNLVDLVYRATNLPEEYRFTPLEFIDFCISNFNSYLSKEDLNNLNQLKVVIESSNNNTKYTATEISNIFGFNKSDSFKLYALIASNNGYNFKLSPRELVTIIINNNDMLKGSINEQNISTIKLLDSIMNSVNNGNTYTSKEISSILSLKTNDVNLIYSLYNSNKVNYKISLYDLINFILDDVVNNNNYKNMFPKDTIEKLDTIKKIMESSLKNDKYNATDIFVKLSKLDDSLDKNLIELVYLYNGSINQFDKSKKISLDELVNYLNKDILNNDLYQNFLDKDMKSKIKNANNKMSEAKELLTNNGYSRVVLNTKFAFEGKETFEFIADLKNSLDDDEIYVIGDSPIAYEMSKSFNDELNFITILTMIAIFIVVAITFKSIIIPLILVLIIECAVYITMSFLSLSGTNVYFISLLIVQSILMGATIDYAIVYTTYYLEMRNKKKSIKDSIIEAYNRSIHTILCSSSILVIVTLIVGNFASQIAAKICMTLSKGSLCAALLILFILPPILAILDRWIIKTKK